MDNQNTPNKSLVEEVVDDLIIRMDKLENQEINNPDNSEQFESLKSLLKGTLSQYYKPIEDIREIAEQQKRATEQ
jgi:hypothetical protein